ncbi:hypothetical protein G7Y79_00036g072430 [Physcia stellaris]|nr:hypothetical protein G7Y79_00036g072430 [Physcia stellaris]
MDNVYTPEQRSRLLEQVNNLRSLEVPTPAPPYIPSGVVRLFASESWNSKQVDLNIYDYVANRRQRLPNSMIDDAEWVAWNLPVGAVMTFTDHVPNQPSNAASLEGGGRTLDLIGSGQTRAGSLRANEMRNNPAAFWWREVDLWQGAVQFFADPNCTGNFATIFLNEWPRDTLINMSGWWIEDATSAVSWKALTDRQTVTLIQNRDGSGKRYDNIKGWGSFKEVGNLDDYDFDDTLSCFLWSSKDPKKEIIDPIKLPKSANANSTSFTSNHAGDNRTDLAQKTTLRLRQEEAQTLTVETSDSQHTGMSIKLTQTERAGAEGIATSETTVEIGFTYDFTTTKTVTRTSSKTIAVEIEQEFNVPAQKHFVADITASIGTYPPADYHTRATRWYDYAVPNGVRDPAENNWYKREEMITFRLSGSLTSDITWHMEASRLA